jgi:hypothetical protein
MDESEQEENRGIWDGQDLLVEGSGERHAEVISSGDLDQGATVVALGLPPAATPAVAYLCFILC